ncbi:MAG: transposase [Planctomycetota bacterium]|jgi:SRSO17 transposase
MVTIGKIPGKLQCFFKPLKSHFTQRAWGHFWPLVLAITISHGCTIERLAKALRGSTHRTNHGEFLWRSCWSESQVMQNIALDMLRSLLRKHDPNVFFIIDDTQTLKRGRKMHAVGKLRHHATGKYGFGHTIVKVCLYYRGVTIPWGSWLYVKKEHVKSLKLRFHKLTDLAAHAIRGANFPATLKITVLFDAFYLCPTVVNACKEKGWHYIGVGKSNRWFTVGSVKRKLGRYGKNVLRNSGQWCTIKGLRKAKAYRLAERVGTLNKLGMVKVVFSRRRGESRSVTLVTDNLHASMKAIVADYLKRWSIEMLIKDEKQHLGLGDYRVIRYQAIVRHLHLVDVAYACLTHAGIKTCRAQGQNKNKKVLRLDPVSKLKDRMRQIVWEENVQDVIKYSHEKPVIRRLEKILAA